MIASLISSTVFSCVDWRTLSTPLLSDSKTAETGVYSTSKLALLFTFVYKHSQLFIFLHTELHNIQICTVLLLFLLLLFIICLWCIIENIFLYCAYDNTLNLESWVCVKCRTPLVMRYFYLDDLNAPSTTFLWWWKKLYFLMNQVL